MLENFLWKIAAMVELQVYTNSYLKNQLGFKCHKIYFAVIPWVAASDVLCIGSSFLFEFCK